MAKYTVDYTPIETTRKNGVQSTSYKFTTPDNQHHTSSQHQKVVNI